MPPIRTAPKSVQYGYRMKPAKNFNVVEYLARQHGFFGQPRKLETTTTPLPTVPTIDDHPLEEVITSAPILTLRAGHAIESLDNKFVVDHLDHKHDLIKAHSEEISERSDEVVTTEQPTQPDVVTTPLPVTKVVVDANNYPPEVEPAVFVKPIKLSLPQEAAETTTSNYDSLPMFNALYAAKCDHA